MGVTMGQGRVEPGRRRMSNDALQLAHAAMARGDWHQALQLVAEIDTADSMAEVWEVRAHARYGAADFDGCLAAWETLHELRLAEGDDLEAARAAVMLAMFLLIDTGLMASVRGWLRRAERLLANHPDTPPHALVATVRSYERFLCGDTAAAREWSTTAIELGTRLRRAAGRRHRPDLRSPIDDSRGSSERRAGPARRGGLDADVGRGRRPHCRDDVLRTHLRSPRPVAERAGDRVDRRDGAVATRCRIRRSARTLPRAPGRDAPRVGPLRSRRGRGHAGVRRVATVDAARVRVAAGGTRQHPSPEGRSRRCRRSVHRGARTDVVRPTGTRVAAPRPGRRADRSGAHRRRDRSSVRDAMEGTPSDR